MRDRDMGNRTLESSTPMNDERAPEHPGVAAARIGDARFRAMFDQAASGVIVFDRLSRVVETNLAFAEMVGASIESLRGRIVSELSPSDDASALLEPMRALRGGEARRLSIEARFTGDDGAVRWASVALSPLD